MWFCLLQRPTVSHAPAWSYICQKAHTNIRKRGFIFNLSSKGLCWTHGWIFCKWIPSVLSVPLLFAKRPTHTHSDLNCTTQRSITCDWSWQFNNLFLLAVALPEYAVSLPICRGFKAVITTHKLTHVHTNVHAKNTSIDCRVQSPQTMLYVHAAGKSKEWKEGEDRGKETENKKERKMPSSDLWPEKTD